LNNIAIPNSASEWTLPLIVQLVDSDCYETDCLEFKELLIVDDPKHKEEYRKTILKTVSAFANSRGGFIVFGVADRSSKKKGRDRIVGLDKSKDLARLFGDQVNVITPNVYYIPQNPPLEIPDVAEKVILVIHIPRSLQAPHAFQQGEAFLFYKRTNKGNVPMAFAEIEKAYASKLSVIAKLKLIHLEISVFAMLMSAPSGKVVEIGKIFKKKRVEYSLVAWNPSLLENAICDLYPIIDEDAELLDHLSKIILVSRVITSIMSLFPLRLKLETDMKKTVEEYNTSISKRWNLVRPSINRVLSILKERYGIESNPVRDLKLLQESMK